MINIGPGVPKKKDQNKAILILLLLDLPTIRADTTPNVKCIKTKPTVKYMSRLPESVWIRARSMM